MGTQRKEEAAYLLLKKDDKGNYSYADEFVEN
jgi:hypothetical protein